jgi:hypothetical protein
MVGTISTPTTQTGDDLPQIKLVGGYYQAKSLIADAQRCLNLYPEQNAQDAPFPFTNYLTPGVRRLSPPIGGKGQGLYTTINGDLYAASGGGLYYINPLFQATRIGNVSLGGRVYMADNATAGAMLVVDGSPNGLNVSLASRTATPITDPNFSGGSRIDFVDGFFVITKPNTNEIYLSNQFSTVFNPLFFAGKTGGGDPVIACVAMHRELWLLGNKTTEVWNNTGAVDFPYSPIPGVFIQQGVIAKDSITTQDLSIYWLGRNPLGQGVVYKGNGYQAKRISTHAIENKIQGFSVISDAIGFMYQQEGHVFYVLIFPTANATFVYDEATQLWHERASFDNNGNQLAISVNAATQAYGLVVLQDAKDGSLMTYDLNYALDDSFSVSSAIRRLRTFPHLINDGKRLEYTRFIADMQTGNSTNLISVPGDLGDTIDGQPLLSMRFSDNRGGSFSSPQQQTFGCTGQENVQIIFPRQGVSKDRIFELSWTTPNITALNGAFIEVRPATS